MNEPGSGMMLVKAKQWLARREFSRIQVAPGEIAIDCGANVGDISSLMARSGGTVHAFEPNPYAFALLQARFEAAPNVVCHPEAVLDSAGTQKLYLHASSSSEPVRWSTGSSILREKPNVDAESFIEVATIDLAEFVDSLHGRVKLMKMDVEGVECRILSRLVESGTIRKIDHIFVETHDHKVSSLRAETEELRALLRRADARNVNLFWH